MLRASQQKLDAFFTASPAGLAIVDDQLRYIKINEALARINGSTVEKHLGRTAQQVVPELAPTIEPMFKKVLAEGDSYLNVEVNGETPGNSGVLRQWMVSYFPMRALDGSIEAVGVVVIETTDRKRAVEALGQSEALMSKAQEIASIGSFDWDMARDRIVWSDEMYRIFGISRDDFGGAIGDVMELIHPDHHDRIQNGIEQALKDGTPYGVDYGTQHGLEYRIVRPDGTTRTVFARAEIIDGKVGAAPRFIGFVQDVTERKRVEEEKNAFEAELRHAQKMDAVGQLASGVAHEFNNLLVGIRGNAELLVNTVSDVLSEQSYSALKDIERAGTRAHDLTDQLLSFARKNNPNVMVFDVNQTMTDSRTTLAKLIGSGITLNTVASTEPAFVLADAAEMAQVIMNLVLNARDAMPDGGTITIQSRVVTLDDRDTPEECQAGQFVELSVSDDGCGMPPEICERIFEPFFTTKEVGRGTGLGLSVAYSDISSHGGFINVDSREGVGTVISVFLPQAEEPAVETSVETQDSPTDSVVCDETILVCDDDEIVLRSVETLLTSQGYSVIAVECAADALAAAESHVGKVALLLTDLTMPGMNGIELGREMVRRYSDMKVLILSGYAADHSATNDEFTFIRKGRSICDVLQQVRRILDEDNSRS